REARAQTQGALEALGAENAARAERLRATEEERDRTLAEREAARAELARTTEALRQERQRHEERQAEWQRLREETKAQFQQLAAGILAQQSETFTKQNKEQVQTLLGPLREQIATFEKGLTEARVETAKERGTLAEQIKALMATNDTMRSETRGLAEALRGQSQTQGAWGEAILDNILRQSGLREGEEYTRQETANDADGRRLRADVVVNLPGAEGRRIVVDAKVSLTAFDQYVNAADDGARDTARRAHLASLRGHVSTLGSKAYHDAIGEGLDYVILFVPIEGALALALQAEPGLTNFAAENNVAIATPTTLMMALRTVANVWKVERRNRSAEEIARVAGRMYDKLEGFVADFQKIGTQMDTTRKTYDEAFAKLAHGRGNLLRQAEQLKELGARTSKSLPSSLLADEADDSKPHSA
ncbi:MAG: DNA recombination protein RmuC, partial [Rhodospirillales bacterium]|nr:DNA recombination protein RmuC [Rhodospirillales bacterium]